MYIYTHICICINTHTYMHTHTWMAWVKCFVLEAKELWLRVNMLVAMRRSINIIYNSMIKYHWHRYAPNKKLLLLSHFSHVRLCEIPEKAAHQAPLTLGFSRQEHWSELPFPSPMHESEKWKWSRSVVSDPQGPHGLQPTRLLHPWDSPGKSTGMGCHCLLPRSSKELN